MSLIFLFGLAPSTKFLDYTIPRHSPYTHNVSDGLRYATSHPLLGSFLNNLEGEWGAVWTIAQIRHSVIHQAISVIHLFVH